MAHVLVAIRVYVIANQCMSLAWIKNFPTKWIFLPNFIFSGMYLKGIRWKKEPVALKIKTGIFQEVNVSSSSSYPSPLSL